MQAFSWQEDPDSCLLGAPISADKPSARSCSIFIKGFGAEVWLHTSSGDIASVWLTLSETAELGSQ